VGDLVVRDPEALAIAIRMRDLMARRADPEIDPDHG
jgi:hypothetical protein